VIAGNLVEAGRLFEDIIPMKIALRATDNRENFHEYEKERPLFGTAPEALLQGFAKLSGAEVHVVSCTQRPMESPNLSRRFTKNCSV